MRIEALRTAAAAKSLQSCPTLCDPIDGSPPGSPVPGVLQARTRVGCHFFIQCMKVKSEREVSPSHPTLSDPMDCSLPGSSVHGIFQARVLEWGSLAMRSCNTVTAKQKQNKTSVILITLPDFTVDSFTTTKCKRKKNQLPW